MHTLSLLTMALLVLLNLSCDQPKASTSSKTAGTPLDCLDTQAEIRGKKYSKEGNHFQIELPENWYVITDFANGLSGSDTLAELKDYNIIGITEFTNDDFDFDTEYHKLLQGLRQDGQVGSMSGKVKVLLEGETEIAGNRAGWVLVEDLTIKDLLGEHVRINYLFQVEGTGHYYIITNESYGRDKITDICELKKRTNTFRYIGKK